MEIAELKKELEGLTQDTEETRPLDSLEMMVVRTLFRSKGIDIGDDEFPNDNTIAGWIRWLQSRSTDG